MKQVTIVQSDMNGDIDVECVFTPGSGTYGQVSVDNTLMAEHTQGTANDVFSLASGTLSVDGVQGIYGLVDGHVTVHSDVTVGVKVLTAIPNKTVSFRYNADGLRTKKTVTLLGRVTETEYILHGKLVTEMIVRKYGEATPAQITEENRLHFFYDAQSRPAMVKHNGITYCYLHNLQGDIIAILDSNGNEVVQYRYDAWGKPLDVGGSMANSLGAHNPFRYRGYVYDQETGLYHLRSRYYNSEWIRFTTRDNCVANSNYPLKNNLFTYCSSTPINTLDYDGKDAYWITDSSNVGGMGHTSLLVQDEEKWFYFYWGPNLEQPEQYAKVYYVEVEISEDDVLGSLNSQTDKTEYGGVYDSAILFEGDFKKTAEYCDSLKKRVEQTGLPSYGVIDNNCMQVSARAMKESYTLKQKEYWVFRQIVTIAIPAVAQKIIAWIGKRIITGPSSKKRLTM